MDKLIERIKKLYNEIQDHRRRYYELNDPIISDEEFDELHDQFLEYQKQYPDLTDQIGWKPYGDVIYHQHKMLSLNSTKNILSVAGIFVNTVGISGEVKVDGLSLELVYKKNKISVGSTRGDGIVGENVTHNVLRMKIPKTIDTPTTVCIYGEVYLTREDFATINESRILNNQPVYTNLRSAAAGVLRAKVSDGYAEYLKFFPYTIIGTDAKTQADSFNQLEKMGFDVLREYNLSMKYCDDIYDYLNHISERRKTMPFEIDGLVFKVDNISDRVSFGEAATHPKWAIAFKFASFCVLTRLDDVIFQVGKSGIIAPVGIIDPTKIMDKIVTRASLSNRNKIKEKDFMIGDVVKLTMGNDVVPKLIGVSVEDRCGKETPIVFPTRCPACNQPLKELDVHVVCTNKACPAQILGKLCSAVSNRGLNIKGLGKSLLNRLIENKLITNVDDILDLDSPDNIDQMINLNIGRKVVKNLVDEISRRRRIPLRKFIFALGIPLVNENTAAKLADYFGTVDNISNFQRRDDNAVLENVDTPTLVEIEQFLRESKNIELIDRMKKKLEVEDAGKKPKHRYNVVITGVLDVDRSSFKQELRERGCNVMSHISSNVQYLITGDRPGKEKIRDAVVLKIPLITAREMMRILDAQT